MYNKMYKKIDYTCKICNKQYSSYKSWWNHDKKFHNIKNITNENSDTYIENSDTYIENSDTYIENSDTYIETVVNINKSLTCEICNKIFNLRSTKSHHKKTCKMINNNTINKIDQLEEKNKKLENTINEIKKQFSLIIKEKGKMHHKTLQKINNQLNNTNNINNGNIINNTFVKFGDLEYQKILNNNQIKQILNKQFLSLEESIKQIHFNEKLPEYNNFFITNMKDDLAYIFNGNQFISVKVCL